jgi:hypothetical protein
MNKIFFEIRLFNLPSGKFLSRSEVGSSTGALSSVVYEEKKTIIYFIDYL